jgi:hypothetical protein
MKTVYKVTSTEIGTVILRSRKIAKALRRWLRERGMVFDYMFYLS